MEKESSDLTAQDPSDSSFDSPGSFADKTKTTDNGQITNRPLSAAPKIELHIVIYSDDQSVRKSIKKALGKRLSPAHPEHQIIEFATGPALKAYAAGRDPIDLFILDGEAVPEGGMGIARSLKDELFNCPPTLIITGRVQDAWLAGWSGAEGVVSHPIDPFTLAKSVAHILNETVADGSRP